jgi:hypothetical protein
MPFDINTHYTVFQVNFNYFNGVLASFPLAHTVYIKIRSKQLRSLLQTRNSNPLNTITTGNFTSHQELRKKIKLPFPIYLTISLICDSHWASSKHEDTLGKAGIQCVSQTLSLCREVKVCVCFGLFPNTVCTSTAADTAIR